MIKDGSVDFRALASVLDESYSDYSDIQGYELQFVGKGLSNAMYSLKCEKQLRLKGTFSGCSGEQSENHSQNTPAPHNIIIGDNLDVLKILKGAYYEKIKCIYIDPPYNTTNDNFIYPDNFRDDYKKLLFSTGLMNYNSQGKEEESELLLALKNRISSKTHSAWLCFMLPRLKLARDLLRDDGVIFISIDDNEMANLKLLCDEIFGEGNFVGDFIRKTKSTTNDAKTGLNYQHEFLLCYAKNKDKVNLLGGQKDLSRYQNADDDPLGAWVVADPSAKSGDAKSGHFPVINPYTGKVDYPPDGRFWCFSKNTMQKHINEGRICFKKEHKENERGFIFKRYLKDLKSTQKCFDSLAFTQNEFMNQSATKELMQLGLVEAFSYPKGVNFIKEILRHSTQSSDIVLDFFAGSGTTAQAVLELNKEDGGSRKCILVQIDEKIDSKKSSAAFDFCKKELGLSAPVISDITIERVKRVINHLGRMRGSGHYEKNKNEVLKSHQSIFLESLNESSPRPLTPPEQKGGVRGSGRNENENSVSLEFSSQDSSPHHLTPPARLESSTPHSKTAPKQKGELLGEGVQKENNKLAFKDLKDSNSDFKESIFNNESNNFQDSHNFKDTQDSKTSKDSNENIESNDLQDCENIRAQNRTDHLSDFSTQNDNNTQDLMLSFNIYSLENKPSIDDQKELYSQKLSANDIARNMALSCGAMLDSKIIEIIKDKLYYYKNKNTNANKDENTIKYISAYLVLDLNEKVIEILKNDKNDTPILVDIYAHFNCKDFLNLGIHCNNFKFVM